MIATPTWLNRAGELAGSLKVDYRLILHVPVAVVRRPGQTSTVIGNEEEVELSDSSQKREE